MFRSKSLLLAVASLWLALSFSACVSSQKYKVLMAERDRKDLALEKSHREIKDLRESKFTLEEQASRDKEHIARIEAQVVNLKKSNEDYALRHREAESQVLKLTSDINNQRATYTSEMTGYQQKLSEMETKLDQAARKQRNVATQSMRRKMYNRRLSLPTALKI
jgi:predicted  nucleic acid-binding Zn-ribbon protein